MANIPKRMTGRNGSTIVMKNSNPSMSDTTNINIFQPFESFLWDLGKGGGVTGIFACFFLETDIIFISFLLMIYYIVVWGDLSHFQLLDFLKFPLKLRNRQHF